MFELIIKQEKSAAGRVILHLIIAITVIFIAYIVDKLIHGFEFKVTLYLAIFILIEMLILFPKKIERTVENLELIKKEILTQNNNANNKFLEIATNNIEDKIYRKLISTNAIILNHDHKIAITARVLEDFPNKNVYEISSTIKDNTESIDLIRVLSYQNLLFTPKYLEYFFYRKDSVNKAARIIVLDREQIRGDICQATLTYIFLSARYGYETYIITETKYKYFIKANKYSAAQLRMIKGNPSILRTQKSNGSYEYTGEFTNYQINNGLVVKITNGEDDWRILENVKENAQKIIANSDGFRDYIKGAIGRDESSSIKVSKV